MVARCAQFPKKLKKAPPSAVLLCAVRRLEMSGTANTERVCAAATSEHRRPRVYFGPVQFCSVRFDLIVGCWMRPDEMSFSSSIGLPSAKPPSERLVRCWRCRIFGGLLLVVLFEEGEGAGGESQRSCCLFSLMSVSRLN